MTDKGDKLITDNLGFVVSMANRYKGRGVDVNDLVSEGNIALIKAAHGFDPSHGVHFVSYAKPFIQKAFENAIAATFPPALQADAPLGSRGNVNLLGVLENKNAVAADKSIETLTDNDEIRSKLAMLNEREQKVIKFFFGIDAPRMTFAEIGEKMSLKRERVRQIRNKALRKISIDKSSRP